jgi:hypothetical protein
MTQRLFLMATAALVFGGTAVAAERPTFEITGFPITPVQLAVTNPAGVQERAQTPSLMLGGMPASPHQVAVLAHAGNDKEQIAGRLPNKSGTR